MKTSKAVVVINAILGKIASITGYFFGVVGIIGLIIEITESKSSSGFAYAFFFIALGAFLIYKGHQIKQRIRRFKKYISLISTLQMTSLNSIASSTSQTVEFVVKDLQKMVNKRFFANATIDAATNEIIIGSRTSPAPSPLSAFSINQSSAQQEQETFTCPNCGGIGTRQVGAPGKCEYCGSYIK